MWSYWKFTRGCKVMLRQIDDDDDNDGIPDNKEVDTDGDGKGYK